MLFNAIWAHCKAFWLDAFFFQNMHFGVLYHSLHIYTLYRHDLISNENCYQWVFIYEIWYSSCFVCQLTCFRKLYISHCCCVFMSFSQSLFHFLYLHIFAQFASDFVSLAFLVLSNIYFSLILPFSPLQGEGEVDSWELWNSFRLLCEHHSQLSVALDIL